MPAQGPGNEITLFSNDEFRLEIQPDGADGFRVLAPPVARQLGYRDAARMLETVPDGEKGYTLASTPGGEQRVSFLTEGGFYRAFGQRQAARVVDREIRARVERFQTWVFNEVLPKLRRGELTPAPVFDPSKLSRLDILKLAMQAEEEKAVLEAALESAAPAIEHYDRYVSEDDVILIKDWAALFGLSEPKARELLIEKRVIYRKLIGRKYSSKAGRMVDVNEYRAYADRVTFDWFDLRPQHNIDRHHNGQMRHTLYVRQVRALELGRKVGLSQAPIPGTEIAVRQDGAA